MPEKKSKSALGLCVILVIALCVLPLMWRFVPDMSRPNEAGIVLMIVAVAATFIGLYVDEVLSGEQEGIERYTVEVCLAAAVALVSLAVVEVFTEEDKFLASQALVTQLGIEGKSVEESVWILSTFCLILVAVAFAIAAVLKKHNLGGFGVLLQAISRLVLFVGYSVFLLSILYAA